jgi:tetratricopeptide (TPR) repeat protein
MIRLNIALIVSLAIYIQLNIQLNAQQPLEWNAISDAVDKGNFESAQFLIVSMERAHGGAVYDQAAVQGEVDQVRNLPPGTAGLQEVLRRARQAAEQRNLPVRTLYLGLASGLLGRLSKQSDAKERLRRTEALLATDPSNEEFLHRSSIAAFDAGDLALASKRLDAIDRYLATLPEFASVSSQNRVLNMRGQIELAKGNTTAALSLLKRSGEYDSRIGPKMHLAKALLERGLFQPVLDYLVAIEKFQWSRNHAQEILLWQELLRQGKLPQFRPELMGR